jgi:mannosyltransferase
MPPRSVQLLAGITAAAAALRFSTLGVQSYWFDEATTVHLLRMDLGGMLGAIPDSESTPPLYYALAWLWSKVFGVSEWGLRSFSALVGTATVPVVYALGRRAISERAGLVAAALTAASPLLVWYSQEARAYALLVLLCALATLLAIEARDRPRARAFVLWALVSALALTTHYFAAFVVAPLALWLLRSRRDRATLTAVAAVGVVGLALLPLAADQADGVRADFIQGTSLAQRIAEVPKQFLVGYAAPGDIPALIVAALLAIYGAWLLLRRVEVAERRRALTLAALGAVAIGVPLLLAVVGVDYLITRNVIAAWVPLFAALAAGFAFDGLGRLAAIGLCVIGVALTIAINFDTEYQRDDWRGVAESLPPPTGRRALVVSPVNGLVPLEYYLPGSRPLPSTGNTTVSEIAAVGLVRSNEGGRRNDPPRGPARPAPPGFQPVRRVESATFTVVLYRSAQPQRLPASALYGVSFDPKAALVTQPASR